ncbi:MAG: DUF47 family protein [Polyangia bacterium]
MVVQRWIQRLLPKDPRFVELLLEQAVLANQVARALSGAAHARAEATAQPLVDTAAGEGASGAASDGPGDELAELEQKATEARRRMMSLLTVTAVTPIDRADLHALSAALHRAIDVLGHAGRALTTYGLTRPTDGMLAQMELLRDATARLQVAVGALGSDDLWLCRHARQEIVVLEKRADELHQDELRRLFRSSACDAGQLLRERTVLDALEEAVDSCLRAADVLERIAIKQG